MMRAKPHKEDPNVNIMLRSRIMTGDDKGKQPEEDGWVSKVPYKEVGFDLNFTKETFMEAKNIFAEASTSESQDKVQETNVPAEVDPSMITTFLVIYIKLLCDSKVVEGLQKIIKKCTSKEKVPDGHLVVIKIGKNKARTGREISLTV